MNSLAKTPPKHPVDHEAERMVASYLLGSGDDLTGVDDVLDGITETHFDSEPMREIARAAMMLHGNGVALSPSAVADQLHENGVTKPSMDDLRSLVVELPGARSAAVAAARRLRQLHQWRRLLEVSDFMRSGWSHGGGNIETVLDQARSDLDTLISKGSRGYVVMTDVIRERADELLLSKGKTVRRVKTGLDPLDAMTGGFGEGELIILAAKTGGGKSALAGFLIENIARDGAGSVLMASAEMEAWELSDRLASRVARIPGQMLRDNNVGPDATGAYAAMAKDERYGRIYVLERKSGITMPRIAAAAREISRHTKPALIVVDYLQLVKHASVRRNGARHEEVAAVARGLKELAGELKVPVLALSQFSREADRDGEPQLHHLRESGEIEHAANQVLFLWIEDAKTPSCVSLKVAKHRSGRSHATAKLHFDAQHMSYEKWRTA